MVFSLIAMGISTYDEYVFQKKEPKPNSVLF